MAEAELRQRKPQAPDAEVDADESEDKPSPPSSAHLNVEEDDPYSPWVDILRVITFLFVASWVLSYLVTAGESGFWGMKQTPKYLKPDWWKAQMRGPLYLTPEELSAFDGSDPSKPLYLAINGTIFDVSNGRRMYGPGGSYHYFAGCDAARAYVTGCFAEDRTPDMRGVELMFIPVDDAAIDSHWTPEELAKKRVQEQEDAKVKAHNALKHWVDFFSNSKKYTQVGLVKRDDDWLAKLPPRELCASARKGRPKRKVPKA